MKQLVKTQHNIITEIDTLFSQVLNLEASIEREKKRLIFLDSQIGLRKDEVRILHEKNQVLLAAMAQEEKNLAAVEKKLSQSRSHFDKITKELESEHYLHEIKLLENQKDILENMILELLSKVESLQKEIAKSLTFEKGSSQSRLEIEREVLFEIENSNQAIDGLKLEIKQHMTLLPSELKEKVLGLLRIKKQPLLCPLENQSCGCCRYQVTKECASAILKGDQIFNCDICGRFLK